MHHSDEQALFVKRWMGTTGFNPVVDMWMHKIGISVVLPNKSPSRHIHVTEYGILSGGRALYLGVKSPKGKNLQPQAVASSRLDYQARESMVHVMTTRAGFVDERGQVL